MSSFVDTTARAVEHCEQMATENPDLAERYQQIAAHCTNKLWHQLTLAVLDLVQDPLTIRTCGGTHSYLALYNQVVLPVQDKLNPLAAARIAACTAQQISTQDMTAAKAILENLLVVYKESDQSVQSSAVIFIESKLGLLNMTGDAATVAAIKDDPVATAALKAVITKNAAALQLTSADNSADSAESSMVHAAHYEQACVFYKLVGPPEAFYNQAIQFLNYAPPPTDSDDTDDDASTTTTKSKASTTTDYQQLAVDLCLAALTGDGVYNLGQVEQTPILELLKKTSKFAWLAELLHATAAGDVDGFAALTTKHAAEIETQPALVHRAEAVQEKLLLLALVHFVFEKDATDRTLSMKEICERLRVAPDQVEWVVMRAFSVHLMEGTMDQVDQTVTVTWVLPRVLNAAQMTNLAGRFEEWSSKVTKTQVFMQEQTSTFA